MNKFNVGDRVKIVNNSNWDGNRIDNKYGTENIRREYNKDEEAIVVDFILGNTVVNFISDKKYAICYDYELDLIKEYKEVSKPAEVKNTGWGFE